MATQRRYFAPEFKERVARSVVEESWAIAPMARAIGVNRQTLRNWVADYRKNHASEDLSPAVLEPARLRELEAKVGELRRKNQFLVRAVAFFASEYR